MRTCSQSAQRTFCLHLHYRSRWAGLTTTCSASNRRSLANWAGLSWRNRQSHLKASLKKALCRRMSCFFWRCLGGALNVCNNASWQAKLSPLRRSQHVHVNLPNDSGVLSTANLLLGKSGAVLGWAFASVPLHQTVQLMHGCIGSCLMLWTVPIRLDPRQPWQGHCFSNLLYLGKGPFELKTPQAFNRTCLHKLSGFKFSRNAPNLAGAIATIAF